MELVRRGLVQSRHAAQGAIEEGRVLVAGAPALRASRLVAAGEPVSLAGAPPRFVGRGGEKLDGALERFGVEVAGRTALDAGASTGGFTDCLLQRGAAVVVAVDVGHGQLDARLRADARVVVLERTNLRTVRAETLAAHAGPGHVPVDLVTADLSFIGLGAVVPVLAGEIVRPGGDLVLLVKPQFEVGRAEASRGKGVVRDPGLWLRSLEGVASSLATAGAAIMDAMRSPLAGASGNVEFFLHAKAHAAAGGVAAPKGPVLREILEAAVDGAPGDARTAGAPGRSAPGVPTRAE